MPFDRFSQAETAVCMRQPMEIDAESDRLQFRNKNFRVEGGISEHLVCDIDYPYRNSMPMEVFRHGKEADGVVLEDGRGRDHFADRAVKDREFAKFVDAWWV